MATNFVQINEMKMKLLVSLYMKQFLKVSNTNKAELSIDGELRSFLGISHVIRVQSLCKLFYYCVCHRLVACVMD